MIAADQLGMQDAYSYTLVLEMIPYLILMIFSSSFLYNRYLSFTCP